MVDSQRTNSSSMSYVHKLHTETITEETVIKNQLEFCELISAFLIYIKPIPIIQVLVGGRGVEFADCVNGNLVFTTEYRFVSHTYFARNLWHRQTGVYYKSLHFAFG